MSSPFSRSKTLPFQASVSATQATVSDTSSCFEPTSTFPSASPSGISPAGLLPEELVELVVRQVEEVVLRERHVPPLLRSTQDGEGNTSGSVRQQETSGPGRRSRSSPVGAPKRTC